MINLTDDQIASIIQSLEWGSPIDPDDQYYFDPVPDFDGGLSDEEEYYFICPTCGG